MKIVQIAILLTGVYLCPQVLHAQEDDLSKLFPDSADAEGPLPAMATFKSPWLINSQTNETLNGHDLLFIVKHRFGDIAGSGGGIKNFFGLDNASDILIALEYGITGKVSTGIGRAKGAPNGISTDIRELYYLNMKYRLIRQTADDRVPLSVTLFGNAAVTGMEEISQVTSDAAFREFGDRMSFVAQAVLARKFSEGLSLAILPTYVRRNYVTHMDMNNLLALGISGRLKITPRTAIVADYFLPFRSQESKDYFSAEKDLTFYHPLGVGVEIETGGHVFSVNFTNTTAILENQFIPSTTSSWTKGQFRWGFTITRTFTLVNEDKQK